MSILLRGRTGRAQIFFALFSLDVGLWYLASWLYHFVHEAVWWRFTAVLAVLLPQLADAMLGCIAVAGVLVLITGDEVVHKGRPGAGRVRGAVRLSARAPVAPAPDPPLRARLGREAHATTLERTPEVAARGYVRAVTRAVWHPGPAARA